ncbi:hypothetical protein QSJ18_16265 [Gordonia sp. ABSL1-1]|uniref:hypothetical protein n=1 Tax=Gordonia sp. ABSL1-1 TaxID=3053923 RepID=UPI0025732B30|nr:hypothetical protein [Gordonia sp. ABSL1-1]MDL9938307.1 hypothetical protein [Gordonia sp. ABSL1-1]
MYTAGRWDSGDLWEGWRRAVEAGGRGAIAVALSELESLRLRARARAHTELESLAWSTTGSLYRQGGDHAQALIYDGRALASASGVAGFADAVVGLAADNLGLGRFGASRRLLDRAAGELAPVAATDPSTWDTTLWEEGGRGLLRHRWVSAELAMYSGDPDAAVAHAAAGLDLMERAQALPVPRHRIKTRLIAAAAQAVIGNTDGAEVEARELAAAASAAGLLPLTWAALSLRNGVAVVTESERSELVNLSKRLTRQGMPFRMDRPR